MELILKPKDFEYVSSMSNYSRSYYKHIGNSNASLDGLWQENHTYDDNYDFKLVHGKHEFYLGTGGESLDCGNETITIYFRE